MSLEDELRRIAQGAAIGGSLVALEALCEAPDAPTWVLPVLEAANSWPVRIRAAEILHNEIYCVVLYHDEKRRALAALRRLQAQAVGEALTDVEYRDMLLVRSPRDLLLDTMPQYELDFWFEEVGTDLAGLASAGRDEVVS